MSLHCGATSEDNSRPFFFTKRLVLQHYPVRALWGLTRRGVDKPHALITKWLTRWPRSKKLPSAWSIQTPRGRAIGSVIGYLVQFPFFVPLVPLTHPDYPLNREFGKVGSLEKSHEDAAEDGDGAPGIRRHYLWGGQTSCLVEWKHSREGQNARVGELTSLISWI